MDFPNLIYLLPVTLLIVFPFAVLFRRLSVRLTVALIGGALCLTPILPESTSVSMYAFSFFNYLSLSLVVAMISGLLRYRWNLGMGSWGLVFIAGGFLYFSTLGYFPIDLYRYGYDLTSSVLLTVVLIFLLPSACSIVIVGAFFLFLFGVYANYFDGVIDPVFWFVSLVNLSVPLGKQWRKRLGS